MKARVKIALLCVCIFSSLFCFAGCDNPFGGRTYDTTPSDVYIRQTDDEDLKGDGTTEGMPEYEEQSSGESLFEDGALDEYRNAWYGVRTIYQPSEVDYLSTTDQDLLKIRRKFIQNASDQYYYFSWYVLTALCDKYGVGVGNQSQTYTFLDEDGSPSFDITYNHSGSTQELKIEGSSDGGISFESSDSWSCCLSVDSTDNYYTKFITTFAQYLQIRFIEIALDLPKTSINSVLNLSTGEVYIQVINEKLVDYAGKIDVLGINLTKQNAYISCITEDIIGQDGYQTDAFSIVSGFLTNFAPHFPTYKKTEICDIDSTAYFNVGQQGNPSKLPNMEYNEYQSATFFYKDEQEPVAQLVFDLYIDSINDMTIDVYALFIKADGLDSPISRATYLCTINTVSDKDFYYLPKVDNWDTFDPNTVPTNNNDAAPYTDLELEDVQADDFLNVYLNPESDHFGTVGYEDVLNLQEGERKTSLLSSDLGGNIHSIIVPVLKNGEEVDLSDLQFYADLTRDNIVLLFDIQYPNGGTVLDHGTDDFGFKYLALIEGFTQEDSVDMFNEEEDDDDDEDYADD